MIRFWDRQTDGQTDGVTALLDLLSPLATQVKMISVFFICSHMFHLLFKKNCLFLYFLSSTFGAVTIGFAQAFVKSLKS